MATIGFILAGVALLILAALAMRVHDGALGGVFLVAGVLAFPAAAGFPGRMWDEASRKRSAGRPVPLDPQSVSARWFWLTVDPDSGARLPRARALDAAALALDEVLAGREPHDGWLLETTGEPSEAQLPIGRAIGDAARADLAGALTAGSTKDLDTGLLLWLAMFGVGGRVPLLEIIAPTHAERRRLELALPDALPILGDLAPPEVATALVHILHEARPRLTVRFQAPSFGG